MPSSDQSLDPSRYKVIPRTLIFLFRGDSLLLIKGAAHKSWAGKYNAIGGHVERGEDVLSSARRELLEETDLQADLRLCGVLINDTGGDVGIAVYLLAADCYRGEPRSSEEGTVEWVDLDRLETLPMRFDDLGPLISHILETRRSRIPFSAFSYYDDSGRLVLTFAD
jgi:8-oxo-dGTP diphosphatase